ncbi:cyclic nucleotide-gated ion channel 1-like [Ziziphus jujuba]|uniref:Cyclic nucleotide-gated ion channel 1-like n=2 Tax=Ziziphus jujuba TaxID=326968 RepID=A0A6P6FZE5_ZIZJJ|nr:cyclic nucleotide-gated ion channel 1-like [Ziziphus jujuba]XP_060675383.1 cyclic nucleotide-gated ion channel 1-like [Ziziphus jujuba]XP_060675384.1 cyclic nucleotide-gated ion channel 1-like [Ziziphus jujuba]
MEENSGVVRIPVGNLEIINEKELLTKKDVNFVITNSSSGNSSKDLRAKAKQIFNPWGPYLPMWKNIFLVSCLIAISIDPLFLYIPYINEKTKCIQMDQKLKIVALVLRCITDISYLIYMIIHMLNGFERKATRALEMTKKSGLIGKAKPMFWMIPWSFILIDILAILPIPQVIILVFFTKLRGSRYSNLRKFLNFLVLFQYVPRIIRIYHLCKKLGRTPSSITGVVWVRGAFNLFLYIIASHALGALWYFFSIEREAACWRKACKNYAGCDATTTFDCNENSSRNLTILNEFCPINPPNATVFDFGIYLDVLQSGIHVSTDFPKKFLQCFWWGLRNLSSFGQNLKTSTNVWETFFAALISIIGLLLFLYLIGNLQTYMQLATTRSEEIRQKLKTKEPEIDLWISSNGLPQNKRSAVMQQILSTLEHDKDVDVENLLHFLPLDHKEITKGNLTLDEIQKTYMKLAATRSEEKRQQTKMKERNAELWILRNNIPEDLKPIIMRHIRYRLQDNKGVDVESLLSILPMEHRTILKENLCLPMLKKVPMLQNMEEKVFEQFINYLKPVVYTENSYIIRDGEPLDLMLFITQGIVWTFPTGRGGGTTDGSKTTNCLQKGDFFGEELLNWTLKFTSLNDIPISTTNVKCHTKVEAFVLMANDSKNLVSTFWWLFRKQLHHSTESELKRLEPLALSAVKEARRRNQSKKPKDSSSLIEGENSSKRGGSLQSMGTTF